MQGVFLINTGLTSISTILKCDIKAGLEYHFSAINRGINYWCFHEVYCIISLSKYYIRRCIMDNKEETKKRISDFYDKNEHQLTDIITKFEEQYNKFMKDTEGESILQIILRAHLYIEYELTEILNETLKHPNELGNRINFNMKLKLLLALDAIPLELKNPINHINTLRNNYAHELNFQFIEKMYDELYNALSGKLKATRLVQSNECLSKRLRDALCSLWIELIELRLINKDLRKEIEDNYN